MYQGASQELADTKWAAPTCAGGDEDRVRFGEYIVLNGSYAYRFEEWQTGMMVKFNELISDLGGDTRLQATGFSARLFGARSF